MPEPTPRKQPQRLTLRARVAVEFYNEVCREAERMMQTSGRLEGMHYAAMQKVLRRWKDDTA